MTDFFASKPWLCLILSPLFFILGDTLAASWGKSGSTKSFVVLLLVAPAAYIFFGWLNATKSLSVSSGLVNMAVLIGTVCIGIFGFNDVLNGKQIIGLVLAIISMGLLLI